MINLSSGKIRSGVFSLLTAVALSFPQASAAEEWFSAGEAIFTDGWITPYFTGKTATWTVAVDINASGTCVRVVEPYASGEFAAIAGAEVAAGGAGCHMIFDISDSGWVTMRREECICMPSGIFGSAEQPLWPTSRGIYMYQAGYSSDAIAAASLNATWRNQTITMPQCMVSLAAEPDAMTYALSDQPLTASVDLSSVDFTAITGSLAGVPSDGGETARFFTLSGMPVKGVLSPGVYIRVTPDGAQKIAVR